MSCGCDQSLCALVNCKVILCSGGRRYCVIICDICPGYIKAIEVGCGNIRMFNLTNIDYIEKV
jgi:hypothetical protein